MSEVTRNGHGDELILDELDLEPRFLRVTMRRRGGPAQEYVVHQATEADSCKAENYRYRKARLEQGRVATVDGQADAIPYLVHLCTRLPSTDDRQQRGAPVTLDTVLSWRPDVVRKLHEWILQNSGMIAEETPEYLREMIAAYTKRLAQVLALQDGGTAKNSPDATPATSA